MPVFYKRPDWAVNQIRRIRFGKVIVEDICEHGIGHPNREWFESLTEEEQQYMGIHGCCSERCCCIRRD